MPRRECKSRFAKSETRRRCEHNRPGTRIVKLKRFIYETLQELQQATLLLIFVERESV